MKLATSTLTGWDTSAAERHAQAAAASKRPHREGALAEQYQAELVGAQRWRKGARDIPRGNVLSSKTPAQHLAEVAELHAKLIAAGTLRFLPVPEIDEWHRAHGIPVGQASADWLKLSTATRRQRPARRTRGTITHQEVRTMKSTTTRKAPKARKPKATAKTTTPAPTAPPLARTPAKGSTMAAVLKVLAKSPEPMHYRDIVAKILRYNMAPGLKGHTPEDTIKAQLYIAAKSGRHGITRGADSGTFTLAKGGDA